MENFFDIVNKYVYSELSDEEKERHEFEKQDYADPDRVMLVDAAKGCYWQWSNNVNEIIDSLSLSEYDKNTIDKIKSIINAHSAYPQE